MTWQNKIIEFEVGNAAYYEKFAAHPIWPGGASGITIGIGYDLGQHTVQQLVDDWGDNYLLTVLGPVCGLRGDAAHRALPSVARTYIPYAFAAQVFRDKMLPAYVEMTLRAFPNCDKLPDDALGALVDLVFNRGSSTDPDDPRRREMLAIKKAMMAQDFQAIPGAIRAMKRLWPFSTGLKNRREWEALTFEQAIRQPSLPVVLPIKPKAPAAPHEVTSDELNQRELERIRRQNYGTSDPLGS